MRKSYLALKYLHVQCRERKKKKKKECKAKSKASMLLLFLEKSEYPSTSGLFSPPLHSVFSFSDSEDQLLTACFLAFI